MNDNTASTRPRTAVIYLRVSTVKQASGGETGEGFSIPAQRQACRAEAERQGAEVLAEFVDQGESARSTDRPQLQAMLKRLEAGDVELVIVHKLDRLARSRLDDVQIALAIRQAGAQLVSVTENIDETPSGKLLHGIMATIAEFYSGNLATEARKGLLQKAQQGGTPSQAPIGYLNVRQQIEGREIRTVIVDTERAPHVEWAFRSYADGDMSIRQLAKKLEEWGLTSRPTPQRPARPLSLTQVHRMLTSKYYIGVVRFKGVEYQGKHVPLIDPPTFRRVQELLATRQQGEKTRKHPHYLKSTVACGLCGSRLGVTYSRGRHGGIYPYFFCYGRQKGHGCTLQYIPLDLVERLVEDFWRRVQLPAEAVEQIRGKVLEHVEIMRSLNERQVELQRARLARLDREEGRVSSSV